MAMMAIMSSSLSSSAFAPHRCFHLLHRQQKRLGATDTSTSTSASKLGATISLATSAGWGKRRPSTAPDRPPATQVEVRALADFILNAESLLVITGAGVSTESSIPDYRSKNGAYSTGFKPMTHQDFMRNDANRRRYWARSFVGWKRFAEQTWPNPAHVALAELQRDGHVWRLITQNVDRLHHAAGSTAVLELHGTTHEVVCMSCGSVTPRRRLQRQMAELNPEIAIAAEAAVHSAVGQAPYDDGFTPSATVSSTAAAPLLQTRPDGDVELNGEAIVDFAVPPCQACPRGGPLKPAVVFFGDSVPAPVAKAAAAASEDADAVLVIGSSVSTFSAFKLVRDAARRGAPVAILTAGETRADDLAALKVETLAGETLPRVLETIRREEMFGY